MDAYFDMDVLPPVAVHSFVQTCENCKSKEEREARLKKKLAGLKKELIDQRILNASLRGIVLECKDSVDSVRSVIKLMSLNGQKWTSWADELEMHLVDPETFLGLEVRRNYVRRSGLWCFFRCSH